MSDVKKLILACSVLTLLLFGSSIFPRSTTDPRLVVEGIPHKTYRLLAGGYATVTEDGLETIQGAVEKDDPWRSKYLRSNAMDTESGYYPQNVFRLVTVESYKDSSTEVYFNVRNFNPSTSPNKNDSNGVYILSRYTEVGNFYMAGLDMLGNAVIRKRLWGAYTTLTDAKLLEALPRDTLIGLRLVTETLSDTTQLKLYVDQGEGLKLVMEVEDTGEIIKEGYAGLRSDFMDVVYENFKVENI
jgi:hypothetical protein